MSARSFGNIWNAASLRTALPVSAVIHPHPTLGEDLAAAVVLRDGATADEEHLRAFLFERVAEFKVPSAIVFVDAIPQGVTGKVQRASLHVQWRDAALTVLPTLDTAAQRAAAVRRLIDDDPFDERAILAALAVLGADGKRAEAQAMHRAYVHHLAEELGVEPSAAVRAAARAVLEQAPAEPMGQAADRTLSAAPAPLRDGFVGRRGERRELLALLQRAQCRVVTILGTRGIVRSESRSQQYGLSPNFVLAPVAEHCHVPKNPVREQL